MLYPRYDTVKKAKEFFKKFDKIIFNKAEQYFEFHFDYGALTNKAEGSKQDWVICSHGTRLENYRNRSNNNQWDTREVFLTREIQELFKNNSIEFENGGCLIEQIIQQNTSKFFKQLIRLLKLTLQMRNSRIASEEDWLISPVKDNDGVFFDSRQHKDEISIPQNADANGAYHIALKGVLILQQLDDMENPDRFKPDLSNKKWYEFAQKNKTNLSAVKVPKPTGTGRIII